MKITILNFFIKIYLINFQKLQHILLREVATGERDVGYVLGCDEHHYVLGCDEQHCVPSAIA